MTVISGFQAVCALWLWFAAVVLFGLWRSVAKPEPDTIRKSGPFGS